MITFHSPSPVLEVILERNTEKEIFRIAHEDNILFLGNGFSSQWLKLISTYSTGDISLAQCKKLFQFFHELCDQLGKKNQLDTVHLKIIVGSQSWLMALQAATMFLKLPTSIPNQSIDIVYEEIPANIDFYGRIKLQAPIEDLTQLKDHVIQNYQTIMNQN